MPKSTQPLAPGDTGWLEITQELLDRRVDMGLYKVVGAPPIGKKAEPAPQASKKAAPKKAAPKKAAPKKKVAPRKPKPLAHSEPGKVPSLSEMLK